MVVSPSAQLVMECDYKRLKKLALRAARRAGVRGGCIIFHPWRENESADGTKNGTWRFSPHFHILGYGWVTETSDVYQETGWLVHNVGVRKSVYATLMYQLSHAGVWMGPSRKQRRQETSAGILPIAKSTKYHTLSWFGCLSYNKLRVPKCEREVERCPLCDEPLVELAFIGDGDPPSGPVGGEYWLDPEGWIARESYR